MSSLMAGKFKGKPIQPKSGYFSHSQFDHRKIVHVLAPFSSYSRRRLSPLLPVHPHITRSDNNGHATYPQSMLVSRAVLMLSLLSLSLAMCIKRFPCACLSVCARALALNWANVSIGCSAWRAMPNLPPQNLHLGRISCGFTDNCPRTSSVPNGCTVLFPSCAQFDRDHAETYFCTLAPMLL